MFAGGFDGGVEAEDGANDDRDVEGGEKDFDTNIGSEWSDNGEEEGENIAKDETEEGAEETENEGFKEELEEDVHIGGADSFADADFVSTFGDGDEHDVHDSDAANDERDAGDEGEHTRDDLKQGTSGVGNGVAVRDGEIGVAGFGLSESVGDFLGGGFKGVGGGDFDVDLLDLEIVVDFGEAVDGNEDGVVEVNVVEINGIINGGENASDKEFVATECEGFADRLGAAKEFEGKLMADDGRGNSVFIVVIFEEGARLEGEIEDGLEVGVGGDDGAGLNGALFGLESANVDGEWGRGGDGFQRLNSGDILEGEVGLGELVGGGELGDDAANGGLVSGRADDNEVGADGFDLVGDETADGTHETEN